MKALLKMAFVGTAVALNFGCDSISKKTQSAGSLHTNSTAEGVHLPENSEVALPNGLRILFLRDVSLPRINIMTLIRSGAIEDPKGQAGLAYLTASLLDEGTDKKSSSEIAENLESLGADLSIQSGYDFTHLSIRGLSYTRATLLDAFLEILLSPRFEEKEFVRVRRQIQASLAKMEDDPDQFADRIFSKVLFQTHSYALPPMGEIESLNQIRREDVLNYYRKMFVPQNAIVAIVGDFDDLFVQQVKTKLSTWLAPKVEPAKGPPLLGAVTGVAEGKKTRFHLKNKKGLVQTQLRFGHLFVDRSHPDFLSLRVANMALGGAFASRLNQYVRDDLGLTYGISSSFEARRFSGPFVIKTFTRNEKVEETVKAALKVFTEFASKGLTEEELLASKSVLIGQFPRAIETVDSLAYQMLALRYYGIEDTYLTHFISSVRALKLDSVNAVIKKYFQPEQLEIIIYGDEVPIKKQLQSLGPVLRL